MKVVNLVENPPGVEGLSALHGLSFYIETDRHRILFDAGPSEETVRNAEKLGIDPRLADILKLTTIDASPGISKRTFQNIDAEMRDIELK